MTHNADYGVTLDKALGRILSLIEELFFYRYDNFLCDLGTELVGYKICRIEIDRLIERRHYAHEHETLYHLGGCNLEAGSKLRYGYFIGNAYLELLLLCLLLLFALHPLHILAILILILAFGGIGILVLLFFQLLSVGSVAVSARRFWNKVFESLIIFGEVDLRRSRIDNSRFALGSGRRHISAHDYRLLFLFVIASLLCGLLRGLLLVTLKARLCKSVARFTCTSLLLCRSRIGFCFCFGFRLGFCLRLRFRLRLGFCLCLCLSFLGGFLCRLFFFYFFKVILRLYDSLAREIISHIRYLVSLCQLIYEDFKFPRLNSCRGSFSGYSEFCE